MDLSQKCACVCVWWGPGGDLSFERDKDWGVDWYLAIQSGSQTAAAATTAQWHVIQKR